MSVEPAFHAYGTRRLRRAGVTGKLVQVALDSTGLTLRGEGGLHRLPLATIERMRVGYVDAKNGPFWETVLWPMGEKPIKLMPVREDRAAYASLVRMLAERVAGTRGRGSVLRGTSLFSALLFPVLIGALFVGTLFVGVYALPDDPWYQRWAPAAFPGALLALLGWRFQRLHRPRAVYDLAEIEQQLPQERRS